MAINDDIAFFYSGSGTAVTSLGGSIHANGIVTSTDQNIFNNVDTAEAVAGSVKFRCFYVKNNGSVSYNVGVFIESQTPNISSQIFLGKGTSAINGTEQTVADEDTAPSGIFFKRPVFDYDLLEIAILAPGDTQAVWIRRDLTADAQGIQLDYCRLKFKGF